MRIMDNRKNIIFWGSILAIGAGLIVYDFFRPDFSGNISPKSTDEIISQATPTASREQAVGPRPTPRSLAPILPTTEPFLGLSGIKAPATCQIGGEVEFLSSDTFASKNTKISWQNIDSRGRLIKWRVSPEDKLAVGPNIFESLPLPDGEYQNPTVHLPENPVSKNYLLTASVTYGQFIGGDLKVKEANCTGQIKVNLNY